MDRKKSGVREAVKSLVKKLKKTGRLDELESHHHSEL